MSERIRFIPNGTVTTVQGFQAGATFAGMKTYAEDKLDLALIVSEAPCVAAGVFTTSTIKSPTVTVNRESTVWNASQTVILDRQSSTNRSVHDVTIEFPLSWRVGGVMRWRPQF